jgi:hypothetical protein
MEQKAQRLIMALEAIALITAAILILVDYKLKNDLVDLYKKMEVALENERLLLGADHSPASGNSAVRAGDLVDYDPPMEASASSGTTGANGKTEPRKRAPANRSRRNGNTAVPDIDKPVGA